MPQIYETNDVNREPLRIYDSEGIEERDYKISNLTEDAIKIFKLKEDSNDPNDFIDCIWYTVCEDRYTLGEINLIKSLVQKVTKRDIPIIVIYTKASNSDQTEEMINNIQNSLQDPNIQVIP